MIVTRTNVDKLAPRAGVDVVVASSDVLPEVDLARVAHSASQRDQHAALRAFRDELRRSGGS